jgi:hypothetical protein
MYSTFMYTYIYIHAHINTYRHRHTHTHIHIHTHRGVMEAKLGYVPSAYEYILCATCAPPTRTPKAAKPSDKAGQITSSPVPPANMLESGAESVSPAAAPKTSGTPGNASRRRRSGAADGEDTPESSAKNARSARSTERMQSESDMANTNGVAKAKGRSARRASQEATGDAAMHDAEQGSVGGGISSVKQEGGEMHQGTGEAGGVHVPESTAESCSATGQSSRSQGLDPESLPCNKQPQEEGIMEEPEVEPQGDTNMADANIALDDAANLDQEDVVVKNIGDDTRHSPAEPPVAAVPAFAEIGDTSASGPCEPSA